MFLSSAATAQSWQDHYRAYDQALAGGDTQLAEAEARQAWLLSRGSVEDSETRALLAHNYAELAVASDPAEAEDVLLDAIALGERGYGNENLALPTLQFMLAETRSASRPSNRSLAKAAVEAARLLPLGQELLNPIITQRVRLALQLQKLDLFVLMGEVGGDLSDDLAGAEGAPPALALQAETLRAVAVLSTQPNATGFRQYNAAENLRRARYASYGDRLYRTKQRFTEIANSIGSQASIEDFDATFASAFLWSNLMSTFIYSYDAEKPKDYVGTYLARPIQVSPECSSKIDWIKQDFRYPRGAEGTNGAVLAGYNLSEDGLPTEIRVLGEIPDSRFGDATVSQLRSWKADLSKLGPSYCRQNRTMVFQFSNAAG